MKAVLLAAGRASRLRPISDVLPKCLMPLLGVPLLEIWLANLEAMGVREVLINTAHLASEVEHYLGLAQRSLRVQLSPERELLGTGGTLFANPDFVKGDDLLVIHADNLSACDWLAFKTAFERRPAGCVATMMTFDTDSPHTCGIVETDGDGRILALHEKVANPPGRRANAAVYIFARAFVKELVSGPRRGDISTEILPLLLGKMNEFLNSGYHRDIGSAEAYLKAGREVLADPGIVSTARREAWSRFADRTRWQKWTEAWRQCGLKMAECASADGLSAALKSDPEVVLVENIRAKDLASVARTPSGRAAVLPWRVET